MSPQPDTTAAPPCAWCPRPKLTRPGTAVTCGDPDCKRLQRNARQLRLQRRHKAETGKYYAQQYPVRHDAHKTRRVVVPCAVCGALLDRRARHVGANDTTPRCHTGPCKVFRRAGRWPRSEVPRSHPIRSTPVPRDHPSRSRPVWQLTGPRFTGRACEWCGEHFLLDRLVFHGADIRFRWCSKRCGNRANEAARGRFRLSPVVRRGIYERDGWRCRLCGKTLNRSAVTPHPLAPTVDHIVPRARGGSDDPANLQAAHFRCNCLKGDRLAGDQLALLG